MLIHTNNLPQLYGAVIQVVHFASFVHIMKIKILKIQLSLAVQLNLAASGLVTLFMKAIDSTVDTGSGSVSVTQTDVGLTRRTLRGGM